MANSKWSLQPRTTAARSHGLPSCFSKHHPLNNFGGAATNNFCTIVHSGTSTDNFFKTIRWSNSSSPLLQQQQLLRCCMHNSPSFVGAAAAACNKVQSPAFSVSSSPQSSLLPVLMLPSEEVAAGGDREEVNYRAFFSLRDNKVWKLQKELPEQIFDAECRGSSKGWLAYVSRRDCGIYLADLFSSSSTCHPKIVPLPSILTLPRFKDRAMDIERKPWWISSFLIRRLTMSSSPTLDDDDDSADVNLNRDCVVMMHPEVGHGLAFCRIGDPTWTTLPGTRGWTTFQVEGDERVVEFIKVKANVKDVVYSRKDKLFYSILTENGEIHGWDFSHAGGDNGFPKRIDFDIQYSEIDFPDFYDEVYDRFYSRTYRLVESPEGDILSLRRCSVGIGKDGSVVNPAEYDYDVHFPNRTILFSVYKLDFEKRIGIPVESLGDTALFLGLNESFSLSTRDHPELRPNSIYFADDKDIIADFYPYAGDDMGIYNFEDYSVTPLYHPFQFKKIRPTPIWVSRT